MQTRKRIAVDEGLVILQASGRLDLESTKRAIDRLVSDSGYDEQYQVLMDLRNVECNLLVSEIREIAAYLAQPDPALPTYRRVAVVVTGQSNLEPAELFAMYAHHRGMWIRAFDDIEQAQRWLDAE
jgi:hypothetical protein